MVLTLQNHTFFFGEKQGKGPGCEATYKRTFPPFLFPSQEVEEGVETEGLGSPPLLVYVEPHRECLLLAMHE